MKINKNDYDRVQIGTFEKLTAGGHKCIIKQAIETQSSTGKPMIVVSYDTTEEDTQPNYYMNDWMSREGDKKKWRGTHNIVMGNEYSMKNLKQLCTAIQDSNGMEEDSFISEEGEVRLDAMKGLKVGIIFREEEYEPQSADYKFKDGKWPTVTKSFMFCNYVEAFGRQIPKIKELGKPVPGVKKEDEFGFVNVETEDLQGLPFK